MNLDDFIITCFCLLDEMLPAATRASQKSPSRSKQPSKRLMRMRGKAPNLPSNIGDLMGIHQREDDGIEDRQHLSHWREAHPTAVLSQGDITSPVQPIFHAPMIAGQLEQPLSRTALARQARPPIDDFDAVLLAAGAFPLQTKDLSHLAPVARQIVVEIRTGDDLTPHLLG